MNLLEAFTRPPAGTRGYGSGVLGPYFDRIRLFMNGKLDQPAATSLSVVTVDASGASSTVPFATAVPGLAVFRDATTGIKFSDPDLGSNLPPDQPPVIPPPVIPPTVTYPAQVLPLDVWKWTLPVNTSHAGAPDEIVNPELQTFIDPVNFYLSTAADDGSNVVVAHSFVNGATTSNTAYPRSEGREMNADGTPAAWSTTSGTHTLGPYIIACQALPQAKPEVVIGQIHDANNDIIELMCSGKTVTGQNTVVYRLNGAQQATHLLDNYTLGAYITLKMTVTGGTIKIFCQDMTTPKVTITGQSKTGCYFKVGAYVQCNMSIAGAKATDYGQVAIKTLPHPTHV